MSTKASLLRIPILLVLVIVFHQVSSCNDEKDGQKSLNVTELDCRMRVLASHYARRVQPFRHHDDHVFRQVDDALQLHVLCPEYFDAMTRHHKLSKKNTRTTRMEDSDSTSETIRINLMPTPECNVRICIYVDSDARKLRQYISSETENVFEVPNIAMALDLSRRLKDPYNTKVIVRSGIHYVGSYRNTNVRQNQPIELHFEDSGLSICGEANAWISGAIPIPSGENIWSTAKRRNSDAILVANLTDIFRRFNVIDIPQLPSLFGPQS